MTSFSRPASTKGVVNFFPNLPEYTDPTTGLLSKLPAWLIPYAELMRIHRPGGFYAYYIPYLIGITYTACIAPKAPQPLTLLWEASILLPLNIFIRGAACSWNDTVDQDFDRRVERCRHRPVARGAVSTTSAHVFTLAQTAAILSLTGFFFPAACLPHMAITTVLFFIYALMKRVTYYPQVFLGFPFAWALFFCLEARGVDPLGPHLAPTAALFASNVLWTVVYDTIYAHQDVQDDERAGVKSMALRFRDSTKTLAGVLAVGMVALLASCGIMAGFGPLYHVGTVGGVAAAMAYYIYDVDLGNPESCGAWFGDQFWTVGSAFVAGLAAEYLRRVV